MESPEVEAPSGWGAFRLDPAGTHLGSFPSGFPLQPKVEVVAGVVYLLVRWLGNETCNDPYVNRPTGGVLFLGRKEARVPFSTYRASKFRGPPAWISAFLVAFL